MDSESVASPRSRVSVIDVVYDNGQAEHSWSLARLKCDGVEALGIRWNDEQDQPGSTPQSPGNANWFIVPAEIEDAVLKAAAAMESGHSQQLLDGYREMAADADREAQAEEWSEALIGDGLVAR